MFYCNDCAKENRWPETGFKSHGKCEVCGTVALCNDRPSALLPARNPNEDDGGD